MKRISVLWPLVLGLLIVGCEVPANNKLTLKDGYGHSIYLISAGPDGGTLKHENNTSSKKCPKSGNYDWKSIEAMFPADIDKIEKSGSQSLQNKTTT